MYSAPTPSERNDRALRDSRENPLLRFSFGAVGRVIGVADVFSRAGPLCSKALTTLFPLSMIVRTVPKLAALTLFEYPGSVSRTTSAAVLP